MHLVDILFPHINDDARSKSHQIHITEFYKHSGVVNTKSKNKQYDKGKGKSIAIQIWAGPEGCRR